MCDLRHFCNLSLGACVKHNRKFYYYQHVSCWENHEEAPQDWQTSG